MGEEPGGADLLAIARKVLRRELIGLLPAERRYDALMVANAMAIAGRRMAAGGEPEARELDRLGRLLGRDGTLDDLNRDLARTIRRGECADPEEVYRHLLETTLNNVRESNPKAE